jgi:thioredoxin reductase (NADPH)
MYDVIIIGSGPAGLAAAIYATRYELKTLVIGQTLGLITEAHKIENWPGERSINGLDLMEKFKKHAQDLGAEIIYDSVSSVNKNKTFEVKTPSKIFNSKAIIIATGTKKRKLNLKNEEKLRGKGVSYCATCDGPFFKDKVTAVIGGGNAAFMSAHILSQTSSKVYLIHRREQFRAQPVWVDRVKNIDNIEFILNANIKKLIGDQKLEKIQLDTGKTLDVDGIFIEIGSIPNKELSDQLNLELERGYIKVNKDQSTNISGVFAAGDITNNSDHFRQVITAAAEGAIAANSTFLLVKGDDKNG